ncbi:MAG TPA: hypothetical protein VHQ98_00450 [Gaiellaceae bacterium]|nr:hypothetical protein [Gaiellaceae bacterium]
MRADVRIAVLGQAGSAALAGPPHLQGHSRDSKAWPTGRLAAERWSSAEASPAATSPCLRKRGATIVSPENSGLYTPMLPEAASGTLEPRHVVVPLRGMCPHSELALGHATHLDLERTRVQVETLERLSMLGRPERLDDA